MAENNNQQVEDIITGGSAVQQASEQELQSNQDLIQNIGERAARGEKFKIADLQKTLGDNFQATGNLQENLDDLRRLRDADALEQDLIDAKRSGSDEDILKASQESLRLKEFGRALGDQIEAEQLAQRTLFRESTQLARQQAQFETGAQQAAASVSNRAAQTGMAASSATQGMIASINTQRGVGVSDFSVQQADITSDQARLATSLTSDLAFLNESFDLGGDIGAAAQSISNRQAREAQRAQDRADAAGIGGAVGTIGGYALGGPIGGAVGGAAGSIIGSVFG